MARSFKVDDEEFKNTLKEYFKRSKRSISEIVNKKAFYIARKAENYTPRVSPERIKQELEAGEVTRLKVLTSGKRKGQFSRDKKRNNTYAFRGVLGLAQNSQGQYQQRIIKILVARLRKEGKEIPQGQELYDQALKMLGARIRSTAFIAAGWLQSIFIMARKVGKAPRYSRASLKHFAKNASKLGGASPSWGVFNGFKATAKIWNFAWTKRDPNANIRVGSPALQQAIDEESKSMRQIIEDRLARAAERSRIKLLSRPPAVPER